MFPVTIRGNALELRELELADVEAIAAVIADEAVLRYTTWKGDTDVQAAERFVRFAQQTAAEDPRLEYVLAIESLATRKVIGTGGIRFEDAARKVGSLRCLLRRDAWGQGIATEAAKLAIGFGFGALDLRRIEADPALENVAAQKVLERAGMRRLEVRPEHHESPSGVRRDSVGFAIQRDDVS